MKENIDYNLVSLCWDYKLFGDKLETTDGATVEIVDTGLYNHNVGPSFFNAKIKIYKSSNSTSWPLLFVGNVMVLNFSSDWEKYSLYREDGYSNVILAITSVYEHEIKRNDGSAVPQIVVTVPENIRKSYQVLLSDKGRQSCRNFAKTGIPLITKFAWTSSMQTEWLYVASGEMKKTAEKMGWGSTLVTNLTDMVILDGLQKRLFKDITKAASLEILRKLIRDFYSTIGERSNPYKVERTIIHVICPWLFAYGDSIGDMKLTDRAFDFLENSKPENTQGLRDWEKVNVANHKGGDSVALRWLNNQYCDRKKCLICRFGREFMKKYKA